MSKQQRKVKISTLEKVRPDSNLKQYDDGNYFKIVSKPHLATHN